MSPNSVPSNKFLLLFTKFYLQIFLFIDICHLSKYNLLKGGDKLNATHKYLCFISIFFVFLFFLKSLLSDYTIIQIFFISFIFHLVVSLYVLYSFFEINILHEKQGSKLSLSKGKLTSNDWS